MVVIENMALEFEFCHIGDPVVYDTDIEVDVLDENSEVRCLQAQANKAHRYH